MSNVSIKQRIDKTSIEQESLKSAPKKTLWSPGMAILIAAGVFVGSQLIASLPFAIYPAIRQWSSQEAATWVDGAYTQFAYVLLAEVLTVGILWWFLRVRGLGLRDVGLKRFRWMAIIYALCGFAVYFAGYAILLSVSSAIIPDLNLDQQQDIGFQQVHGFWQLGVTFISLVILPPLAEEIFFRGFLFTSFRRRFKLAVSIVLTSLLFAAPHLLESKQSGSLLWVAGIDTFVLSVVLCYMREKTASLWSGILLHALKNGIAFASLFVLHAR